MANASHEPQSLLTLSLATPAYNEADGIETIVTDWLDYLNRFMCGYTCRGRRTCSGRR